LNIKAQKVAYLDFELSAKQFENRYSKDFRNHYLFSENFYRANINPYQDKPKHLSDDEFLNYSIEELVKQKDFKFLIIDNITYLNSDMERARDALPLMKHLQALKAKYKLSILVLAHTPKRDMSKPITINDIQGSKMLINFTDSAFAIGRSYKDSSLRYIKQIKQRNTEEIYGSDNVVICQIIKESNFLEFRQIDFDREMNHLRTYSESEVAEIDKSIISLKEDKPSLSNREIAKQLKTNHTKVGRVLKRLEAQQLDLNM
jgi:hypothetical protein